MKNKTLPQYPSELIRVALNDLKKIEKDPAYTVNMNCWHIPAGTFIFDTLDPTECHVCFAGSVMAKTFDVAIAESIRPDDFNDINNIKFRALDRFRRGDVSEGFSRLQRHQSYHTEDFSFKNGVAFDRDITPYQRDAKAFHEGMRKLARDLEQAGY